MTSVAVVTGALRATILEKLSMKYQDIFFFSEKKKKNKKKKNKKKTTTKHL